MVVMDVVLGIFSMWLIILNMKFGFIWGWLMFLIMVGWLVSVW